VRGVFRIVCDRTGDTGKLAADGGDHHVAHAEVSPTVVGIDAPTALLRMKRMRNDENKSDGK